MAAKLRMIMRKHQARNRANRLSLAGCAFLGFSVMAPLSAKANQSPDVVNCYDAKRDHVQIVLRSDCVGEVVSDERAEAIKQRRIERIREKLENQSKPLAPGKRLVSIGTGFFVAPGGVVLTNNHVVASCPQVSVTTTAGQRLEATIQATSPAFDLALLKTKLESKVHATFARKNDQLTDLPIVLVGYPNQGIAPIKPLLTPGRTLQRYQVSRLGVMVPIRADVRKGNSGGPVIDESGRVIGVITAKIDTVSTFKQTGKVVRDVGYAVSNSVVLGFLENNQVTVTTADVSKKNSETELFDGAKPYIVRVGCWQ
ncbi:trypsin-like peptidase domain-containing protein [Denitrobaculum tricleocarpae]|uniref:Trypsin-like peptidase domain-containing protein n=2 Tax=Denitrobaculum tricleocarpae TaxID=2591009 RepID=A0A545TMB7_9PROT|nr:trypsin-like peptidase domain-containing protein [Denitrobaculum tricleocarpae]